MIVKLKNVRLAFPNLFTPQSVNGSEPKFNAVFLIDPNNPVVKEIEAAMLDVAKAKWGAKGQAQFDAAKKGGKVCLRDGADKPDYDGFEGNLYLSASNATRPMVLDRDRSPLTQADGRPYAGCYVHGSVEIWAQDNQYGKRINASLRGVQFFKDGDSFAGGTPVSEDEFDDLGEGVEDDLA